MHYKIIKESKPNLKNYGRYKAVAVHYQTVDTARLCKEIQDNCSLKRSDVKAVLAELSELLVRHLQDGHRVRLDGVGLLKLEIESDKVDSEKHPQLPHPPVAREPRGHTGPLRRHTVGASGEMKMMLPIFIKKQDKKLAVSEIMCTFAVEFKKTCFRP